MRNDKFILNARGEPVPETDLYKWGRWMDTAERQVGLDKIGDTQISTVFLGLDHSFDPGAPPVLWETMIFCGSPNRAMHHDEYRCAGTREQAEAMHAMVIEKIKALQMH